MRDLADLLLMGAANVLPASVSRRRMAAAYRGHAPQPLWGTAYHATRLLRNAYMAVR